MGNNPISEGYLFRFSPVAVWEGAVVALSLGTGTPRSGVVGLRSCREMAEQASGALGRGQAAQPGPPHS